MASNSDEEDFVGFEAEDVERARLLLGEMSDESDILVSSSSSSESENDESEDEELDDFWSRDDSPVDVEDFVEPTGPTSRVPDDGNAMDFFFLLWPEELFAKIVEQTNRNAQQCIRTKPDPSWYETTCKEMRAFVALNVLFGVKSLPETRLFWSKNPYLGVTLVQKVVPRNRLEKIRQYLHLNNQENMLPREDPNFDKLFKIRPLLDTLSGTFREEYQLSKFVSIDEGMVKYKGRLGFKQYMPMKPVKRLIKIWVLADATNRTDFPADLKPNKQGVKALCRGESVYQQQGNIVVTVWRDKKLVSFISTV